LKELILNADDLGICESTNFAISRAYSEGGLTSASLLVTAPAFRHAVEQVAGRHPGLQIGLHLSLTSGRCQSPPDQVSALVDDAGRFRRGFASLWSLMNWGGRNALTQVRRELESQFQRFVASGIPLNHVDGHRHVHMIPPIFELVADLAREYGCPRVRLSCEPFPRIASTIRDGRAALLARNLPKQLLLSVWGRTNRRRLAGLSAPDQTFGIVDSGRMDATALRRIVEHLPSGVTEVITHPGLGSDDGVDRSIADGDLAFLNSSSRRVELEALLDSTIRSLLARHATTHA
jgi:hopanoid biosynthesis associated protein HpnK